MSFIKTLHLGTGHLSLYFLILHGHLMPVLHIGGRANDAISLVLPLPYAALVFPRPLIPHSSVQHYWCLGWQGLPSRMLCTYQFATVHPFTTDFPGVCPALPAGGWESCNFPLGGLLSQHALTNSDLNFHWLRTWFWEMVSCTPEPNVFHLIREKANELVTQDSNFLMFSPILPFGRSLSQATAN